MHLHQTFRAILLGTALLAGGACGDTLSTRPQSVLRVSLVGLPDRLGSGDVVTFAVQVKDAGDREVTGRQVTLASTHPEVALIDRSGRVRAVAAGTTTITATVEGVVGSMQLTVDDAPASLELSRLDGERVPTLLEGTNVGLLNGGVEYREIYLESGSLQLSGGAQPRYQTVLHVASYAVTFDDAGQRQFAFRSAADLRDQGSVSYDARGDLVLTSDAATTPAEAASSVTGGFTLLRELWQVDALSDLFFRRVPP